MAAIMGTGILAQAVEYRPGFGPKQMVWILHAATMGAMLAPMCFLGGQILTRAAWYTAGIVGGLSTIAVSIISLNVIVEFTNLCCNRFMFTYCLSQTNCPLPYSDRFPYLILH